MSNPENFGIKVRVVIASQDNKEKNEEFFYRNVTEIHYNFKQNETIKELTGIQIAFESDIHGTGATWRISRLVEFETSAETEKAESF